MKCFRRGPVGRSGVTLMELLVASVILSISLLGAYQASRAALVASARMDRDGQSDRQVRDAFEAVGRDLRCAVVAEGLPDMNFTGQNGDEGGSLAFATLSGDATAWRPGTQPALRRVSWSAAGGKLTRAETALSGPGGSHTGKPASGVERMTCRFYQGANPGETWNSDRDLPTAVQITLAVNGLSHRMLVRLPAGKEAGE